ncbi:MAG: sigma-70 family RNA polymerase sigma factor [Halioglobus sp.]|nr:sigma-70 family RNA polymerase sigma factor [Halioglobus sp.]
MRGLSDSQKEVLLAGLGGLRTFCLSLTGNPADADDLLQVTVERVLQKGMPADAHAAKWAYRVCKNAWVDEVRSRGVRQRHLEQVGNPAPDAPSAEVVAGDERKMTAVFRELARLPVEQRLALTLVAIDGKTYSEAADILNVPIGTIMSRIARARKQLIERDADQKS